MSKYIISDSVEALNSVIVRDIFKYFKMRKNEVFSLKELKDYFPDINSKLIDDIIDALYRESKIDNVKIENEIYFGNSVQLEILRKDKLEQILNNLKFVKKRRIN